MDLSTTYLGFNLPHPFMPGASPLSGEVDSARLLEDAGAPMITMPSLFEEQIEREGAATSAAMDMTKGQFAEALSYLPEPDNFSVGPEEYLDRIYRIRQAVEVPVVASLNGSSKGGWLDYASKIEQAGADALELNLYRVTTDFDADAAKVEKADLDIVRAVTGSVKLPVAVKLSPFYSSLPHFARQLDQAGAKGIVIFNRFYQPDIDIEELELMRSLQLSDSSELLLRLRSMAILSGNVTASLAITGGVHTATDAIKAVMAGAHGVQLVSALLLHGPQHLKHLREQVAEWMEDNEYESLKQMQGSMNLSRCPDASVFTRANYMYILQNWKAALEVKR